MKIAAAQIACVLGDVAANIRKIAEFALRAKSAGAELIVFPEMVDTGYSMSTIKAHASRWTDGAVSQVQAIAKELSVAIVSGVSERDGDCIYNSQVFIDSRGAIIGKYRKTHLFTPIEEHKCFSAGRELASFSFAEFRLGLSICYDLRFPEVYRTLAIDHGANVLIISSAWPFPRVEHFRVLAAARAIENQSYLVAANRVGRDGGTSFCGTSAIIDPYGVAIAAASADREELVVADVSEEVLHSVRTRMPVFADRRQGLYGLGAVQRAAST
jgi:predicted amidohydrolase